MDTRFNSLPSSRNPVVHALSLVVGAVLLVGAAVLGAFILAIALGIGLVFAAIVIVRVWWMQRKIVAAQKAVGQPFGSAASGQASGPSAHGRVIDVEYTVVESESDESAPPR